ncbi:MAG: protein kinase [Polyangiaceae bacterium]
MSSELTSGQLLLDRYRLDRRLGEGGMSVVWAGTHVVTGKQVALKLLKSEASGDEATRRRMLREARAACAVVHRNVVQIHDVLELPSGAPVLVMDLLSGESLRDRLQRRRTLSVSETATLLVPVVSAAGTAHAAGVIHRDLKPDNIHLAEEDGDLCVKVLDFGIAKLVETGNNASQINALTNTGTMLGTPYYMAPEQILGEPIDHRIDIWALGVILYECLAGERPTEAENIGKILKRVLTNEIEPLTARCPQLPREVTTLVDRMLSQNAASRPSMREIGETLTPFANGVTLGSFGPPTLAADPDITEDRPAPPPRKKPAPPPAAAPPSSPRPSSPAAPTISRRGAPTPTPPLPRTQTSLLLPPRTIPLPPPETIPLPPPETSPLAPPPDQRTSPLARASATLLPAPIRRESPLPRARRGPPPRPPWLHRVGDRVDPPPCSPRLSEASSSRAPSPDTPSLGTGTAAPPTYRPRRAWESRPERAPAPTAWAMSPAASTAWAPTTERTTSAPSTR